MLLLCISAQQNQNAGWDFWAFPQSKSKRKLFKVTSVLVLTAMETEQSLYFNQLLRMNLHWFIISSPSVLRARPTYTLLMYVQKKHAEATTYYSCKYFEGGRLRVFCQCRISGSWLTNKIQRNTYFCALNKKSFGTEYKYGEVISKFITTTLFIKNETDFETD